MKKLFSMLLLMFSITQVQSQFLTEDKPLQFNIWNDPWLAIDKKQNQIGVSMTKVMRWGYITTGFSYAELNISYFDWVTMGGPNFHLFNYERVRYYSGLRLGLLNRDWKDTYPLVGFGIGFDFQIGDNWGLGLEYNIDYREDQEDGAYGDSDAYKPGFLIDNFLLQENGVFKIFFNF